MVTDRSQKAMAQGEFVLENSAGEIVRSFRWSSERVYLIERRDSRRIETVASLRSLHDRRIPHRVLAEFNPESLRRNPVSVGRVGVLRWCEGAGNYSTGVALAPEKPLEPKRAMTLSVGLLSTVVMLFGLAGLFSAPESPKAKEEAITLLSPDVVEKMVARAASPTPADMAMKPLAKSQMRLVPSARQTSRVVVAPSNKPLMKAPAALAKRHSEVVTRTGVRNSRGGGGFKSPGSRGFGTNERQMNQIGALGAFDRAERVAGGNGGRGGLNLRAVGTEPGSGAGGRGHGGFGNNGGGGRGLGGLGRGSGQGLSNAMYGKGLIAAPFGDGSPAPGSGGYGTRGRAGGGAQGAGYGEATVVGSWKGTGPHGHGPAGSGWGKGGEGLGPGVESGDSDVGEGLERAQVEAVIERNLGQVVYCYETGLQSEPSLKGRVAVRFEIAGTGRVAMAKVARSTLRQAAVESCIVGKLRSWAFPKPRGGVTVAVTYPFLLSRQAR